MERKIIEDKYAISYYNQTTNQVRVLVLRKKNLKKILKKMEIKNNNNEYRTMPKKVKQL